ncbi:hypothetical protein BCF11_2538 [Collimonas sp. PA-H2]|uniref:DUF6527 family protein n=1 Tax=Collimonas sp. PA-H2 TaxID=1881062 RepID=UPI000C01CC86|nr:DUF6527 family protein [Collimonas sp. PA-H2]PFH10127.1 hypothetical protein BCF11_2538 [Collimonas sp. PA-H2]
MMQHTQLEPRFVKSVPKDLEPGVLYVSMEYGTAIHSCCCGCGHEVVTPLTPTDWSLKFNGEAISLWPSIGNWNLPCRSHYVIEGNQVIGAGPWDKDRIEAEQKRDKVAKTQFYAKKAEPIQPVQTKIPKPATTVIPTPDRQEGIWVKLRQWLS